MDRSGEVEQLAVQDDGRWRFVQVHLSSGVPDIELLGS
jgi:hypothetical protein